MKHNIETAANKVYGFLLLLLLLTGLLMFISLAGCSFYMSVSSTKEKAATYAPPAAEPVKEKPKTRYQQIKDEHNKEWLNLPHRESEHELFEPK